MFKACALIFTAICSPAIATPMQSLTGSSGGTLSKTPHVTSEPGHGQKVAENMSDTSGYAGAVDIKFVDAHNSVAETVNVDGPAAPIQFGKQAAYVAKETKMPNGTIALTPGTVAYGVFSLVRAFNDKAGNVHVVIQYQTTKLQGLPWKTEAGLKYQIPHVAEHSLLTSVIIKPGQTLNVPIDFSGKHYAHYALTYDPA